MKILLTLNSIDFENFIEKSYLARKKSEMKSTKCTWAFCWLHFRFFSGQIGLFNKIFLGNMALLIRSYYDILQSWQYLGKILAKIFPKSWQDLTKISMEGRPGSVLTSDFRFCSSVFTSYFRSYSSAIISDFRSTVPVSISDIGYKSSVFVDNFRFIQVIYVLLRRVSYSAPYDSIQWFIWFHAIPCISSRELYVIDLIFFSETKMSKVGKFLQREHKKCSCWVFRTFFNSKKPIIVIPKREVV